MNYSIIQAHLGKQVPPHVYEQIRQTRLLNKDVPIFLILSAAAEYDRRFAAEQRLFIVRKESIRKCRNHRLFSLFNRSNRFSLGGFWLHAMERFFAIESFLAACPLENVVHLENDVMLYAELDRLVPALAGACPGIGITLDSERRCVPGFVFIRNREALEAMNAFAFRASLLRRENDMAALASYMREAEEGACTALPVAPPAYRAAYGLRNARGQEGASPWYDKAFDAFGGVFDAAALGQYLGGVDRRLVAGSVPGFVNETAVYDARRMGLSWKVEGGLRRPYGKVGELEFPIFNLHIHSKALSEFSSAPEGESR